MRYAASEKLEIIRLVEQSSLPVRRTLGQIGIPKSTFYSWYDSYAVGGPSMRWKITGLDPNASATAFQMRSAKRSSSWPSKRETHKMMLDHHQQTKNMLVSYSPKALGFF